MTDHPESPVSQIPTADPTPSGWACRECPFLSPDAVEAAAHTSDTGHHTMPYERYDPTPSAAVAPTGGEAWVVWSIEHNAWWAADERGYRDNLLRAGVYTEMEALGIERAANCATETNERAMPLSQALGAVEKWEESDRTVFKYLQSRAALSSPVRAERGEAERDALRKIADAEPALTGFLDRVETWDVFAHRLQEDALAALTPTPPAEHWEQEWEREAEEHAATMEDLTEAQHALVLLANQLEMHSVPFVPDAEAATAKARQQQEEARRLDAVTQKVIADVLAKHAPPATPTPSEEPTR